MTNNPFNKELREALGLSKVEIELLVSYLERERGIKYDDTHPAILHAQKALDTQCPNTEAVLRLVKLILNRPDVFNEAPPLKRAFEALPAEVIEAAMEEVE